MANLTFKVHMLAFEDVEKIRPVDIPESEVYACTTDGEKDVFALLERIFHYGQNMFQSKPFCSVSMGDVAHVEGKYYLCMANGWEEISEDALEKYRKVDRDNRSMLCYGIDEFKSKIAET